MSKCNDSVKRYTPIELVTVFNNWLTDPERCVICIEGIYKKVPRGKYVFDYITDDKACLELHFFPAAGHATESWMNLMLG